MVDKKEQLRVLRRQRGVIQSEIRSLKARRDNAGRASRQAIGVGSDEFYYRVGMDFRGRLYYKGAHMNPQMGDDVKVILTLANKKPLGLVGYQWLCWGVASAAGFDKADFKTRVEWTMDRIPAIRKAVEQTTESELFMDDVMSGGEPALFLQRATELINAYDSGSLLDYETNITIAMDATCSGLQILSAVAKDRDGGSLVNITATGEGQSEKNDVYGKVAKLMLAKYANMPDSVFAKWIIQHGIPRRFTKRPVMTLPYSATIRSATGYVRQELQGDAEKGIAGYPLPDNIEERKAMQIDMQMLMSKEDDDMESVAGKLDDGGMYYSMSVILARDIHEVCRATIPAAMNLLAFFKSTPGKLKDHAIWNTPDGLQVKQRYGSREEIQTKYKLTWVDQETGEICEKPIRHKYQYLDPMTRDRSKAANGMPPNWVHSLDGTLVRRVMLMAPFEVVAIHDSFAAHPADCEELAKILREQFVWLVQQDPLGTLVKSLNEQVGAEAFNADHLMINTWDENEALNSEFLFC